MTIYGLDTLGDNKYKALSSKIDPNIPKGRFATTFGDSFKLSEDDCRRAVKILRIQLTWAGDAHLYTETHLKEAIKQAKRYQDLATRYTGTIIYLSPFCEHTLRNADPWLDEVAKVAPACQIVNSTIFGGGFSNKHINEIHGNDLRVCSGRYLYSYDGTSCFDSDVERMKKRHKRAEIFFMWAYQFNGKCNEKDKTQINNRNAWPTQDLIKSTIFLFSNKGKTTLKERCIWKPSAEQTKNQPLENEPRACKPCYVTPTKAKRIVLKDANGNDLVDVGSPLPYKDGRWRYYFPECGYRYYKLGGVSIFEDGKKVGVINPGFREGEFR